MLIRTSSVQSRRCFSNSDPLLQKKPRTYAQGSAACLPISRRRPCEKICGWSGRVGQFDPPRDSREAAECSSEADFYGRPPRSTGQENWVRKGPGLLIEFGDSTHKTYRQVHKAHLAANMNYRSLLKKIKGNCYLGYESSESHAIRPSPSPFPFPFPSTTPIASVRNWNGTQSGHMLSGSLTLHAFTIRSIR